MEGTSDPGIPGPHLTGSSSDLDWQTFSASYEALSQATNGSVDQVQMAFSAVSKMADSVHDPHTFLISPDAFMQLGQEQALTGGIGLTLNGKQAPFVVQEVVPAGPADQAGLRPGDSLVAVNGCDVSAWDSRQLTTQVRGPAGTPIHLTVNRPSVGTMGVDLVNDRLI